MRIAYEDGDGRCTERMIRPFAVAYYVEATLICAWCELRGGIPPFPHRPGRPRRGPRRNLYDPQTGDGRLGRRARRSVVVNSLSAHWGEREGPTVWEGEVGML